MRAVPQISTSTVVRFSISADFEARRHYEVLAMVTVLACCFGLLTALPGHAPQDAGDSDFRKRVSDLAKVVGASPPVVKFSYRPLILTASDESGTIVIDVSAAQSEFSYWEVDAALAREVVYKARAGSVPPEGATISGSIRALFGFSNGGPVGSWTQGHRVASIGETIDLLLNHGQSPVALLTLFESERRRLGVFGIGTYESIVGGSYDELIVETKKQLARRHIAVARSAVSLVFCVKERIVGSEVAFEIFGRQLLRLSQAEATRQPHIAERLNRFFDQEPEPFQIALRGNALVLKGEAAVTFGEPDAHERAKRAAVAIRASLSEYSRRTAASGRRPRQQAFQARALGKPVCVHRFPTDEACISDRRLCLGSHPGLWNQQSPSPKLLDLHSWRRRTT